MALSETKSFGERARSTLRYYLPTILVAVGGAAVVGTDR